MEPRVNDLLPLAGKIAREFANIPGLPHSEIEMAAQEALANAARLFDPSKGAFTAYASCAMRNALRDLYERQVRHHQHHVYEASTPSAFSKVAMKTSRQPKPPPPSTAQIVLAERPEIRYFSHMKTTQSKPEKCKTKPAPPAPLFGHLKPVPQSLSPEERTSQFLQNNRLASSRKRP